MPPGPAIAAAAASAACPPVAATGGGGGGGGSLAGSAVACCSASSGPGDGARLWKLGSGGGASPSRRKSAGAGAGAAPPADGFLLFFFFFSPTPGRAPQQANGIVLALPGQGSPPHAVPPVTHGLLSLSCAQVPHFNGRRYRKPSRQVGHVPSSSPGVRRRWRHRCRSGLSSSCCLARLRPAPPSPAPRPSTVLAAWAEVAMSSCPAATVTAAARAPPMHSTIACVPSGIDAGSTSNLY